MSEVTVEQTRSALRAAENPVRLVALLHASANGHVSPRDAKNTASNGRSGTAQYHIGELVRVGLLERRGRGRYVLTAGGQAVVRLHGFLAGEDRPKGDFEIDVWGHPDDLRSVFPAGERLDVTLAACAARGPRSIRIHRSPK